MVPADLAHGEGPLPGLKTDAFLLYSHMADRASLGLLILL